MYDTIVIPIKEQNIPLIAALNNGELVLLEPDPEIEEIFVWRRDEPPVVAFYFQIGDYLPAENARVNKTTFYTNLR